MKNITPGVMDMEPGKALLIINLVAFVIAAVLRSGINREGTGWLERDYARLCSYLASRGSKHRR